MVFNRERSGNFRQILEISERGEKVVTGGHRGRRAIFGVPKHNLTEIREGEGLSKADLARLSDISVKTIYAFEHHIRDTKRETKYKIVNGLNRNPRKTRTYTFKDVFPNG